MKIEFLQTKGDVVEFVDFLYNMNCELSIYINTLTNARMDRQAAKEALIADLILAASFGVYYIGVSDDPKLLTYESCGRTSHPRAVGRMSRYAGVIALCDEGKDMQQSNQLFKNIRKYFKKNYKHQKYNPNMRFCCYFGPHYQEVDTTYLNKPEPSYICPGYIRIHCEHQTTSTVLSELQMRLRDHPKLMDVEIGQRYCRKSMGTTEVYAGFLFDRSKYGTADIITLAKELTHKESGLRVVREKRYETVDARTSKTGNTNGVWSVCVFVEQEWKGFGNFCTPETYFV